MLRVIYRTAAGLHVLDAEFDDEADAARAAGTLRETGCTDVTVLVDIETADQTARAMAFTARPLPVAGRVAGPDSRIAWRGPRAGA